VSGDDIGIIAMSRQADCIKLHQMFILPEYQKRGIGEACMRRIIEDAASTKLPIRLQVLKVNSRAFTFYQRLGFGKIGETDNHILMERLS
jgi:ribosomal protein S18 acetylase RimI-like enzyme